MNKTPLSTPWWLLPSGKLRPWWWLSVAALFIVCDFFFQTQYQFPSSYVVPVILAAWYSGAPAAAALSVVIASIHILFVLTGIVPVESVWPHVTATTLRGLVILLIGIWFARLSGHERALESHVRRLEGLLPICAFCKSIRNESGQWEQLEGFISKRSEAEFSHGFCPTCERLHYGDLMEEEPAARP